MSKKRKTKEEIYKSIRKPTAKPTVTHKDKRRKQIDRDHKDQMKDY